MSLEQKPIPNETVTDVTPGTDTGSIHVYVDKDKERSVVRKLDWHLLPVCMTAFVLNFLDRSNIGNAKVAGMVTDLHMPGYEFNVAVSIFYVTYIIFEIPLTLMMKKIGPSKFIPSLMLAWSIVSAMTGFIQSGASLIAVRLVLGMTESALFPSLNVYISLFWKREEIGKRVACILAANSLAGALGGIFATVVTRIDGVGGYEGWRWLYFVEGMVSFVVSICFYFLIPDTPDDAYFLNAEEKEIAKGRMGGANTDVFNWPDVKAALTSPMCWLSACIELCADVYNFSVSAFLPTIVNGIGYTALEAQYMTIPVYLTGAISVFAVSWVSDRIQKRGQVILVMGLFIMTAYGILLGSRNNKLSYAACYILLMGQSSIPGLNLAWISGNTQPYFKRATAITMVVMLGNAGGIAAGQIYRATDKPRYPIGHGTALASCFAAWVGVWIMLFWLRRKNAQKARLLAQGAPDPGKGDERLEFRYIL